MKRLHFIFLLAAVLVVSCTKEGQTERYDSGLCKLTVEAAGTGDISKISLSGTKFSWDKGDGLFLRMPDPAGSTGIWSKNPSSYDRLTTAEGGSPAGFKGPFHYFSGKKAYFFYGPGGNYTGYLASEFEKVIPSTQSGKLSDIKDYALIYAVVAPEKISKTGDTDYTISSFKMTPHFGLMKFNVAAGNDVRKITVGGVNLCGKITLRTSKEDGVGADKLSTLSSASDEITIERSGAEISGDVYVVFCPDKWSSNNQEYYNTTKELTITFTNSSNSVAVFRSELNRMPRIGELKSLGSISKIDYPQPSFPLAVKLSGKAGFVMVNSSKASHPFVVPDNDLIGQTALSKNPKFYYAVSSKSKNGTVGFDTIADPTTSSTELTKDGFDLYLDNVMNLKTPSDSIYIKVLAKCSGYADTYVNALVRFWQFGKNFTKDVGMDWSKSGNVAFSAPFTTVGYRGLLFSNNVTLNSGWSYRMSIPTGTVTTSSILGGKASMYICGYSSKTGGTKIDFLLAGGSAGSKAYSKGTVDDLDYGVSSTKDAPKGCSVVWKYGNTLSTMGFAILEFRSHYPEGEQFSDLGDSSHEGLVEGDTYSF